MLWLFVIAMVGGLLFVMFHKPTVNPVLGLGAPIDPPVPVAKPVAPKADVDPRAAETQPSMTAIPTDLMSREPRPSGDLDQLIGEIAAASSSKLPVATASDPDEVATAAFVPMDFNDIFGRQTPGPRA